MADYQTPAEIAEAYIINSEVRASLETDIREWYNLKIAGIKTAFSVVINSMDDPTPEEIDDAIENMEIFEEEES